MSFRWRFRLAENVTYRLIGKDGRSKKLFQPNELGKKFFSMFGKLPKIPLIFGVYRYSLNVSNLITNAGIAGIASRINGNGAEAVFNYIAIGTGTTAANATDTTLETEITTDGGERKVGTATRTTTDITNDTAVLSATFTFSSSFTVTESWVLNAASGGTLLARQVFADINVNADDSLVITWNFDVD